MPNAIGVNLLDTSQLDPGYVCELVERFDMVQVTVVEATHPDKAFACAKEIQRRRGDQTDIFYRRWRADLPDERMVAQTTPEEFVRYMQDVLEAGFIASVYNEAQQIPMTPLTAYSVEVIERTAHKGWRTVHFKTSTGTPRGYKGEQPDGYAESDALWKLAVEVNKGAIDADEKPLVHVAPHAYFPTWGRASGHTDRPAEIIRRLKQLELDPRYLPISIGETGLIEMAANGQITDAEGGWRKVFNLPEAYARLYVKVTVDEWLLMGAVGHLFSLGDQQTDNGVPGQWYNFNLMRVTEFWDELERATAEGELLLPVAKPPVIQPNYTPQPLQSMGLYHVKFPGSIRMVYTAPDRSAETAGTLVFGQVIKYIDRKAVGQEWWYRVAWDRPTSSGTDVRSGWLGLDGNAVRFLAATQEVPTVPPPISEPQPPPAPPDDLPKTRAELQAMIDAAVLKALQQFFAGGLKALNGVAGQGELT